MTGGGQNGGSNDPSAFSYKRVYFARKGSINTMAEKNNNIHAAVSTSDFTGCNGIGGNGGEVTTSDTVTKAFLLQYRDNIQNEMNLAFLRNEAKKGRQLDYSFQNGNHYLCAIYRLILI